jgi:pyruvate dehydrogenase E1 component beta subunit
MARDPRVYVLGLGVTDPKGTFGTTLGLLERYGPRRVLDMPNAENAMTGIAIGSALVGMRPIMTHQRADFVLLALDQLINNAAKWHFMFGGRMRAPLVVRLVIGRGWGQGPQHSQNLQALFAHVPGLKVVMPTTPHDAKGLLVAAVEDDNPVIVLEDRWLHGIRGHVPEELYRVPLGSARTLRSGRDVTLVATGYMALEAQRAAEALAVQGIDAEVIDVRTLAPFDATHVLTSVRRTGRLVVADAGWRSLGFAAEVVARIAEEAHAELKAPPRRVTCPDAPTPTTPALANHYYPRAADLAAAVREQLGRWAPPEPALGVPLDLPDPHFRGPF